MNDGHRIILLRGSLYEIPPHPEHGGAILTVQPLGVVLEGPLEAELLPAGGQVVEVRPENDGVGFGEFGVGSGVESGQVSGVALFHPNCRRIVRRVVGTLGDPHSYSRYEGVAAEVGQIPLHKKKIK